jgi:hypothetical protein
MNWNFKKDAEPVVTGDYWYDLTNGYLDLQQLLVNEDQIKKLQDAIKTIESFEKAMQEAGLLERM